MGRERNAPREMRWNGGTMQGDVAYLAPCEPELERDGYSESEQKQDCEKIDEAEHGHRWKLKVSGESIEQPGSEASDGIPRAGRSVRYATMVSILRQVAKAPRCRRTQP